MAQLMNISGEQKSATYRNAGVKDAVIREYRFVTEDGLELMWTNYKRGHQDGKHIVALVHGNVVSSEMFVLPEHYNLVNFLLDNGHTDIWSLDWRTSTRFGYNQLDREWSCDDVALYDMPAAFKFLSREVGDRHIHVVAHCVGSLTLAMAISAGLVTGIRSMTCHSVHLITKFKNSNTAKLTLSNALLGKMGGIKRIPMHECNQESAGQKLVQVLAEKMRENCTDPVCNLVNFIHSSTAHGLFNHDNITRETHDRLGEIFADLPISIYDQIMHMNLKGVAVKNETTDSQYDRLPRNYMADAHDRFNFPVLFLAGSENKIWFDSCELAYKYLSVATPANQHELAIIPGYGHMDLFWSPKAYLDVFPKILDFLDRHRG
jgi:cholesterol oxidase